MFALICKRIRIAVPKLREAAGTSTTHLSFLECSDNKTALVIRSFLSSSSLSKSVVEEDEPQNQQEEQSFTGSYLVHACGLSPENATSISKMVHFESPEGPDSVLSLLRDHGFTDAQLSKIVRVQPQLLLADPENTLLPKFKFLYSIGFSNDKLVDLLLSSPFLFAWNLNDQLVPFCNFVRSIVLDDSIVVKTLKRSPRLFLADMEKNIVPNIAFLREIGMPVSFFPLLLGNYPNLVLRNHAKFKKNVEEIIEMGVSPSKTQFIQAMRAFLSLKKSTLENKKETFKKWGWSEDDIRLALQKYPSCFNPSVGKITSILDYIVNKMGWKSAAVAKTPAVLNFSLEKRIIPRCLVIRLLWTKGLINRNTHCSTVIMLSEKYFLSRFVTKYEEDVPNLLDIYSGRMIMPEAKLEV
ncbi:Transcription termination factor like [Quillaja saponaria]|uniref:Transcription termination factor like n=1 Tax=Quillaja saponaria TaxID=32244 RepID=A0AAD7Q9N6_QUISA|nr:Transcription termination factor like [Quillaja saponaria]KAJ7977517.1 Transcription termination factor like [Quillaja saponaria]